MKRVGIRIWASPVVCCGMHVCLLGQWVESWRWTNSQHRKNCVSLSSCWKPKSQEGNKSFVPEPRESSVFRGIPIYVYFYASVYLYIRISWLYYNITIVYEYVQGGVPVVQWLNKKKQNPTNVDMPLKIKNCPSLYGLQTNRRNSLVNDC